MFAADPSAIAEAVQRHMARTPTARLTSANTEDIRRRMAEAATAIAQAGERHTRLCMVCCPQRGTGVNLTKCRCVERCSWPHCTKTIIRTDPVLYSEGVTRAPVPRFKETTR